MIHNCNVCNFATVRSWLVQILHHRTKHYWWNLIFHKYFRLKRISWWCMVQKLIYYILDPQLINQNVFFFQLEVDGNFHKRILCPNVKFGPKSTFILHSMCRVKYRTCFPLPFLLNCSPIPQKMSNSPQCMFKNQFQKWELPHQLTSTTSGTFESPPSHPKEQKRPEKFLCLKTVH